MVQVEIARVRRRKAQLFDTMSARPTNRYLCELCDATFRVPAQLKQHVDAVHLGLRPFVCSYDGCNAKFTLKGNLNKHVRSIHEGEEVRAAWRMRWREESKQ